MKKSIYIALAGVMAFCIFMAVIFFDMLGIGGGKTQTDINVAEGMTLNGITQSLKSSGVITSKTAFKVYARVTGEHIYQMGVHSLNSSMSYRKIIKELETAPVDNEVTITIPEGYEVYRIADKLEQEGLINRDVFMREVDSGEFDYDFVRQIPQRANRLEGYLFPDTYRVAKNATERDIINTMLANFEKKVIPVYQQSGTSYSLDDIVKLASVIEREAGNDGERKRVASVFVNRLNRNMKLESCATVQYILGERKSVLSNSDTQIDSPYNTYRNSGLPIGPIASPGLSSVESALYPEQTNYLYFMAVADGSYSMFAETFEEHLENQRQLQ